MGFGAYNMMQALRSKKIMEELERQDTVYSVSALRNNQKLFGGKDKYALVSGMLVQDRENGSLSKEKQDKRLYKSLANLCKKQKLITTQVEQELGEDEKGKIA